MRRLSFCVLAVFLSSCYAVKAYRFRKFKLDDLDKIGAVPLPKSPRPFLFAYDTLRHQNLKAYLDSQLRSSLSYAFLVIRNDSILYERYFGTVAPDTKLPSFSAAKSFTGTLIGIALHEGRIKSLDEPIRNYLPELKASKGWNGVTLQHLLDMRSGVESNESYTNPFSDVLKLGFARNVSKHPLKAGTEKAPGSFDYKSVNTQLLALAVERATGRKLHDYAAEKLWAPLGMEHPATWNSDAQQTVRAFCCLNAAARDYAKFGRLYLRNGAWEGRQVVPADWVHRSTAADTMAAYGGYKNQWWADGQRKDFSDSTAAADWLRSVANRGRLSVRTSAEGKTVYRVHRYDGSFYASGMLGQYVYVHPAKNLVVVRLGHNWSHPQMYATRFIQQLAERL